MVAQINLIIGFRHVRASCGRIVDLMVTNRLSVLVDYKVLHIESPFLAQLLLITSQLAGAAPDCPPCWQRLTTETGEG